LGLSLLKRIGTLLRLMFENINHYHNNQNKKIYRISSTTCFCFLFIFWFQIIAMDRNKKPSTRKDTACPVFVSPCKLPETMLPTYEDIMKFCQSTRIILMKCDSKIPTLIDISVKKFGNGP